MSDVPGGVDEDFDPVAFGVREVHRPGVAVAERHDAGDAGFDLELLLQSPEIVKRPTRSEGNVVDAVGSAGLVSAGDERHLMMMASGLGHENDLGILHSERAPITDLEPQDPAVELDHELRVLNEHDSMRNFLNDPKRNKVGADKAEISEIFNWFSGDFKTDAGSVEAFINRFAKVKLKAGGKISYLEYDWRLNEAK